MSAYNPHARFETTGVPHPASGYDRGVYTHRQAYKATTQSAIFPQADADLRPKTTYVEPLKQTRTRANPTYESKLFTQNGHSRVKSQLGELRYDRTHDRSTTPQPAAGATATQRAQPQPGIRDPATVTARTAGGSLDRNNRLNEVPAGMLFSTRSGLGQPGQTYLAGRDDVVQPKPAGKFVLSTAGEPVSSSKIDHMRTLIHVEQPAAPILDQNTTYARSHSKEGFPIRHQAPPKKEVEYHPQEVYFSGVPGNVRHPFKVNSKVDY